METSPYRWTKWSSERKPRASFAVKLASFVLQWAFTVARARVAVSAW